MRLPSAVAASAGQLARSHLCSSTRRGLASVSKEILLPEASSSADSQSQWRPPIAPGVEPAYDEALKFITSQQEKIRAGIPALQSRVKSLPVGSEERIVAEAALDSHLAASLINDPATRWRFQNDPDVPLTEPVFAHLREKAWRANELPRITERVQLMSVVPDAVASVLPLADVQVAFGQGSGIHDHGGEGGLVQVGCFVDPVKTLQPPAVRITPFHRDERLYTLALIDSDAPYEYEDRLGNFAHWIVANVPLSLSNTEVKPTSEQTLFSYIPPHPQQGTRYHRYSLVLLEQSKGAITVEAPAPIPESIPQRQHFDLNAFARQHDMRCVGLHFWRAKWSEASATAVSNVYDAVLQTPERRYERLIGKIAV